MVNTMMVILCDYVVLNEVDVIMFAVYTCHVNIIDDSVNGDALD